MKLLGLLTLSVCLFATEPNEATRRWWSHVTALANDGMEGRDTGSAGYQRAARYVAGEFERAGLKPAGENGYYQSVPLHVIRLQAANSSAVLKRKAGVHQFRWLREITMTLTPGLPEQIAGGLVFAGSDALPPAALNLEGKILVRLGAPVGTPAANRPLPPLPAGMLGTLGIDNLDGPERRRWPAAYAVNMDLYNGAFDDAAYVATLLDLAEKWKESGTKLRRSVLFAVVTGEEKGLLGSRYFAAHPTVPKESMVANINLDQLRPLFPLRTLTMLALEDSTLGDTARAVAEPLGIHIQGDPEPDRNLLRRSDHFNFMQIGVPATGFVFGFEKGSREEAIYREWYSVRYHSPADDLKQPWDPAAAAKFNEFFGRLVETIANASERPRWKSTSKFAPGK